MPKTTTLHIGTTKTGSTSIQNFMADHRAFLAEKSVLYPTSLGEINHNAIPVFFQGQQAANRLQKKYDIQTPEDYTAFEQAYPVKLADEIALHDPDHIIISSEHMHSRCSSRAHFARLKQLLAPALTGRDLRIVVYLRPQISHIVSLYSTMLRHGTTETVDTFVSSKMEPGKLAYFDFDKLLHKWSEAFPEATIIARPFDRMAQLEHGVLSDFLALAGLAPFAADMTFAAPYNQSMSSWTAETLRLLNTLDPALPAHVDRMARKWLRNDVQAGTVYPDVTVARAFQAAFDEGNKRVCDAYFDGDQSVFDVDWEKYAPAAPSDGPTPAQMITLWRQISA